MAGLTVLRVVSGEQLKRDEDQRIKEELQDRQTQPVITGMAAYVRQCWEAARDAKRPIETMMLDAKRQRKGEYDPAKLVEIKQQGGSAIFMKLTEVKCRAAEAWIRDIMLDTGSQPWELQPTPIPDLSPKQKQELDQEFQEKVINLVMELGGTAPDKETQNNMRELILQEYKFRQLQVAQNRTDGMTTKIKDQFAEGGWEDAFNEFVTDLTTYPSAFVKGPVVRSRSRLVWDKDQVGKTVVKTEATLGPEYERVDPFRIYPEPGITNIKDGYMFEHHPMPRSELAALIDVPNYDADAIREILETNAMNSWFFNEKELEKNELENKPNAWRTPTSIYDVLEFWGKISGKMLVEWGMDEESIPDKAKEYDACVWLVGDKVIKAVLNYDPLGEKPYAKSSFFKVPGAFWGMGIPQMIEDIQSVCNAAARSLVNNMGIASGPQVEVNISRLPQNEDIQQMFPWKIWQVIESPGSGNSRAINFNQPNDNSAALMAVFERFSQMADEHSGIPAYVSGDISVTGAGRTSSGLSMLMGAAGKSIRQVISYIDNDVTKVMVKRQFVYNMRYDEDESIKGDVIVTPLGAVNLAVKETTNVRRLEFLNATANPVDMEIMGKEGRAAVIREVAKALQIPADQVIPSREQMRHTQKLEAAAGTQVQQIPDARGQQQGALQAVDPSGAPKGGYSANTVSNRNTGAA